MADEPNKLGALAGKAQAVTQAAAEKVVDEVKKDLASYTCHPMSNYQLGKFIFENGSLKLNDPKDIEAFENLWKSQPPHLQNSVRKVDQAAAEARLKEILAAQGGMQTGMSTTDNNNPGLNAIDPASADAGLVKAEEKPPQAE